MEEETIKFAPINIDEKLKGLFSSGASADGSEEFLREASTYSLQLSATQMQAILRLEDIALEFRSDENFSLRISNFCKRYLELRKFNNSASFVMRIIDSINLGKWIKQGMVDISVQKK